MCKDCEKIDTCGKPTQYATCIVYEGYISTKSPLEGTCSPSVDAVLEDIYVLIDGISSGGSNYQAGDGLILTENIFSANFGLTDSTVMRGSWRPDWLDIQNRPDIPQPVNIIGGNNVTVTGTYPNLIINSFAQGSSAPIETISMNNQPLSISINKNVNIPIATQTTLGVVKAGINTSIGADGAINVTSIGQTYTAGAGININGSNQISNTSPNANHTGDVTGSTTLTITDGVVSNSKLTNIPANTIKGNNLSQSGVVKDLTISEVKSMLNIAEYTIGILTQANSGTIDLPVITNKKQIIYLTTNIESSVKFNPSQLIDCEIEICTESDSSINSDITLPTGNVVSVFKMIRKNTYVFIHKSGVYYYTGSKPNGVT